MQTPAGPVPRVSTELNRRDHAGSVLARLGLTRDHYTVTPGLYCIGAPGPNSPVLVTANYKLSFDALRRELGGLDLWLLVVDTHGINVWCAAGKGTFSTEEVAARVLDAGLEGVVAHRKLILPQLCATGVGAHRLRKLCGFGAEFGPVRASDVPAYLGGESDEEARRVTFTLAERAVLVPVEIVLLWKAILWAALAGFVLSGFGPGVFSLAGAWERGLWALAATGAGVLAGTVAVPLLLAVLPGRAFSIKGAVVGVVAGVLVALAMGGAVLEGVAVLLWATALSSFLGMNFTGSTPYTSPSGVEHEMRRAIPLQALAAVVAELLWLCSPFVA